MDENIYISFISDNSQIIKIPLSESSRVLKAEDILKTEWHVYADMMYTAEIEGIDNIQELSLYMNGRRKEVLRKNNRIIFLKPDLSEEKVFEDLLGFVRVTAFVVNGEGDETWLYSDYISIMVPETTENQNYSHMLNYIYENQKDLFYRKALQVKSGKGINEKKFEDFYSQILLIEKIIHIYEEMFGYFKANSRTKLEPVRVIADANKIRYVDEKVISYVVQHPENLKEEAIGIKYGRRTFLPEKSLMVLNQFTGDVYENQIIIGFLDTLFRSVSDLKKEIAGFLEEASVFEHSKDGYIASAYFLYKNSLIILRGYLEQLKSHEKKLQGLVGLYKTSLKVSERIVSASPQPSAIFMSVPQYNRIFICILQWFNRSGYELQNERRITTLFDRYTIYEFYVLSKLIKSIKDRGFKIQSADAYLYPKMEGWKYKSQECNNIFEFVNEDGQEFTLYYEPIIYTGNTHANEITGLYRNNTVSLHSDKDTERRGSYYVPDFVLKYYDGNKNRFMVCDAKVSSRNTVRFYHVPDLSFKYLLSISCINTQDQYIGMTIFYEKGTNTTLDNFYDMQREQSIKPYIYLAHLSESLSEESNRKITQEIIGMLMDSRL